jgi:non-ribosomal peptide synthetase component F
MGHLEQVLKGMATFAITEPVHKLPLLSSHEEKQLLIEYNNTKTDYDQRKCLHELFEEQAKANPKAVALVYEDQTLTYSELNSKANQVANFLVENGVKPNTLVGLCLERSLEMVIGLFGILKAGGAYVPLDPSYPPARLQYMLQDSQVNFLVTQEAILTVINQQTAKHILCLDDPRFWAKTCQDSEKNLDKNRLGLTSNDLAYVIYTSGSTGKPKGVKIHHKNVMNLFKGLDQKFGCSQGQDHTWLAITSICFDISVLEIFWTLSNGNKVILAADAAVSIAQTRPVDFSLFYFAAQEASTGQTYELLLEGAKFADQHGLAGVWVPERHFSQMGHQFPNPSVAAAAVAVTTNKIKIRAGSVVLPLHDPIRVAEEWSMVDNLSNGRVEI